MMETIDRVITIIISILIASWFWALAYDDIKESIESGRVIIHGQLYKCIPAEAVEVTQ